MENGAPGRRFSRAMLAVLESAARLQHLVPDSILVGGTAAALHAGHRESCDHDHVISDLAERFEIVLETLEREPDWVTNRVTPGKIILGSLGDIEAGVRQMIRQRPLEFEEREVSAGVVVRVPTIDETLRIKGFLIVRRNQVRDYLDVAAISTALGVERSAHVLSVIDDYYADRTAVGDRVASQLVRQLGNPRPRDARSLRQLDRYKRIEPPWHEWSAVRSACVDLAAHIDLDGIAPADGRFSGGGGS